MKLFARTLALGTLLFGLSFAAPSTAHAQEKAGPMMLNMKLGPAIGVSGPASTQFALEFEFGYAIAPNAYFLFPLGFQFGGGATAILVPIGFQYDIAFPGVKNFYLYPRISIGYVGVFGGGASAHGFLLEPGFGIKYVLKGRFNFGFEPFRLPIGIGFDSGTSIQYSLKFYAGFNF